MKDMIYIIGIVLGVGFAFKVGKIEGTTQALAAAAKLLMLLLFQQLQHQQLVQPILFQ